MVAGVRQHQERDAGVEYRYQLTKENDPHPGPGPREWISRENGLHHSPARVASGHQQANHDRQGAAPGLPARQ